MVVAVAVVAVAPGFAEAELEVTGFVPVLVEVVGPGVTGNARTLPLAESRARPAGAGGGSSARGAGGLASHGN